MLKSIYIDGLRSLREFSLNLEPGLMILVGPNGSGKTNILTALELISRMHRQNLQNFNLQFGLVDVANLFDAREKNKNIHVKLEGEIEPMADEVSRISYTFEFVLNYQPELTDRLYFSQQLMELEAIHSGKEGLVQRIRIEFENGKTRINHADDIFTNDSFRLDKLAKYFNDKINQRNEIFKYNLIASELSRDIIFLPQVLKDFRSRGIFDIDPNLVRYKFRDPAEPILELSGMGLASTVLEIVNNKESMESGKKNNIHSDIRNGETYEQIFGYFKQLSPELVDLNFKYDDYRQKIDADVRFVNQEQIPLEFMSDGSLKWLTMITALLTSPGMFFMEEPENFLHPNLQQQFIELTRSVIEHRLTTGIISTHSESILNTIDPQELIVTNYRNGRTHANKVENAPELKKSLQESGLELGWYYTTGGLDPEPLN